MLLAACSVKTEKPSIQLEQLVSELTDEAPSAIADRDFSQAYFERELTRTKQWIEKLERIDTSALTPDELVDWKFARSILAGRELEQAEMEHFFK